MLAGATVYFLVTVNHHYAIRRWLFFLYAEYWGLTLWFNAACLSAGFVVLRWLLPRGLPLRERLVLSMACGVLTFYLGAFVAGLAHLYGLTYFLAWPALLVALGASPLTRTLLRVRRAARVAGRSSRAHRSLLTNAAAAFGVLALGLIYLVVMTPDNVAYDARWYHLPIAENYVAIGGIEPFREGWYQGALPHLASLLYAWAMMWPLVDLVDRVLLCSHLEFSLFLWTLLGVSVLARRVVPRRSMPVAWVAIFLFPGIFLYDSNLNTTADHIAAFWGPPIFLALLSAWRALELRRAVLLGAMLAAAISTKYQSASLVVFPLLVIALRAGWLTWRPAGRRRAQALVGALVVGVTLVVVWAPHWLKNLVWYGDPFYPILHARLHPHPWTADTDLRLDLIVREHIWVPKGSTLDRLRETVESVWWFSLEPHDWGPMHRDVPVFGSLFTLLLPAMPFLRASRRLWGLVVAGNLGVMLWYWTSHQDRYLQALVPWFAAATAGAIALAWASGWAARVALAALVSAQVVWGGDVPFLGTHRVANGSPIKIAVDRIASGFDQRWERRTDIYGDHPRLGESLPRGAHLLVHEEEMHLGLVHATMSDAVQWQGGLSYSRFRSPAELWDRLRSWGLTHVVLRERRSLDKDSLSGDIAFFDFVTHYTHEAQRSRDWLAMEIATERPADRPYGDILWLGCGDRYAQGVYRFDDMRIPFWSDTPRAQFPAPTPLEPSEDSDGVSGAIERVDAIAIDPRCSRPLDIPDTFSHVTDRDALQVWIRVRKE